MSQIYELCLGRNFSYPGGHWAFLYCAHTSKNAIADRLGKPCRWVRLSKPAGLSGMGAGGSIPALRPGRPPAPQDCIAHARELLALAPPW